MSESPGSDAGKDAKASKEKDSAPSKGATSKAKKVSVRKSKPQSMWADPVVRILGAAVAVIIVGALLTVVVALLNGTINLSGAPQTATQRYVDVAEDNWNKSKKDNPSVWQDYVVALLDHDKVSEAKDIYNQAKKAKLEQPEDGGQELMYMDAAITYADGKKEDAAKKYKETADKLYAAYEKELNTGGDVQNWAKSFGVNANWQKSMDKYAAIQTELKDYKGALATLDTLIEHYPFEAGYYIDRGNVKLKLDDKEGAKKDFEQALKFLPDDPEAREGLGKAQ